MARLLLQGSVQAALEAAFRAQQQQRNGNNAPPPGNSTLLPPPAPPPPAAPQPPAAGVQEWLSLLAYTGLGFAGALAALICFLCFCFMFR